jgi:hypothetical protein
MKDLTTGEVAALLKVAPVTVRLWCRQKRFPNAYPVDTPRGVVWYIPHGDLNGVGPQKPGPKPKPEAKPARRSSRKKPEVKA